MKLKRSILFWSLISAAAYLALISVLGLCGLWPRVWLRESLTILTAAGALIGVLQLLLRIPDKKAKIIAALLWTAAAAVCCFAGTIVFAFYHPDESAEICDEKSCIAEEDSLFHKTRLRYYEAHGLLVRGIEPLHEEII